jgi:two-component system catabolic regulation response regulator CreB
VEDDPTVARALAWCLRRHGDVTIAATVRDALLAYRRTSDWAALIVDVGLPDGSGLRLLEELRPTCPELPALVITGALDPEHINGAYRLGARSLAKPVRPEDLDRFARSIVFASRLETVARRWAERYGLSPAETDVLIGAALGEDREAIARRRESTLGTVKSQVEKLIDKTGDLGLLEAANRLLRESQH